MTERPPVESVELSVSRIFEIVQSLSGQGNTITIPCPYLDFFAGDRQQHLLAAILNQLVFWSGKSHLENGWFYKEHAVIASEVRASSEDVIRKAMSKIISQYLPGVIEEKKRKVNGTPKMHYRINEEALIAQIFPQTIPDPALKPNGNGSQAETADSLDSALKPKGNGLQAESVEPAPLLETALKPNPNGSQAESKRLLSRMETAHEPNPGNGSQAESILYTDLKNRSLHTDLKTTREKNLPVDNFHGAPQENTPSTPSKTELATNEDFAFSRWFWSTILELYERAAEYDGTLARPHEPNWSAWANEARLLREEHGCTHQQMQILVERIQRDPFWCSKIQSVRTLRDKWPELVLKLCPGSLASNSAMGSGGEPGDSIPPGFRG